jgi:signal transduction histidine kinase
VYDALGQSLTALKLDIQWVSGRLSDADESLRVRAREMETLVSSTIDGVRHLARELRPATLDTLGLIAATRSQVRDVEQRTGIRCNLTVPATEPEWSEDRRTTVFRILQEALTNVVRHAQAKQVAVALWERDNEIVLEVRDDGRGITAAEATAADALGIVSMRERARLHGGSVRIAGLPGGGTTVTLRLPHAPAEEAAGRCCGCSSSTTIRWYGRDSSASSTTAPI